MKALEDLHYSRIVDRSYVLRAAIGRPRTALWIGPSDGASLAEEVGARVVREKDVTANETFDLAFVSGFGGLASVVAGASKQLGDGAHLVLDHGSGLSSGAALAAIEGAGLEPLWHGGVGPFASTVSVARKRPAKRKLSLTVGMISMNEEGAVGGVIDSIRAECPEAEILLIDSSKDRTPAIAEAKGARVLRQFPPRGYGPAMTRLLYSTTTDVVVTMDCDGTYPADRIRGLHELIEQGADVVNTSRTHVRPSAMPLSNFVANRTFAAIAGLVHRFSTTDLHSGMRAYRTSMLRGVYVPEKGAALPAELLVVPARHGYRMEDVNIEYLERIGSSTLQRWDSTVWTFRRIFRAAVNGGSAFG